MFSVSESFLALPIHPAFPLYLIGFESCLSPTDAPTCSMFETRSGDDVVLVCEVAANPVHDLVFEWSMVEPQETHLASSSSASWHNDTNATSSALSSSSSTHLSNISESIVIRSEGQRSTLMIPMSESRLLGRKWSCFARNSIGATNPNCTLFVEYPIGEWMIQGRVTIHPSIINQWTC